MLRYRGDLNFKWEGEGLMLKGARNTRAKQNKEEAENNLKLSIDPALVIVHIFHSPRGPIPVS